MGRVSMLYLACLAVLAVGVVVELWPALQGRHVDVGSVLRLLVLMGVTGLLMVIRTRRKV